MSDELNVLCDTQAEAGVIATLVHHPEFILQSDYLKPGYFYHKENGCIYWAIDELFKSGVKVIDTFNITNKLQFVVLYPYVNRLSTVSGVNITKCSLYNMLCSFKNYIH